MIRALLLAVLMACGDPAPTEVGTNGSAGSDGEAGATGLDGADGATGPEGAAGPQGPEGPKGAQGPQGTTGPAGADGQDGVDASAPYRWVDANGVLAELLYFDANGYEWEIDPETGGPVASLVPSPIAKLKIYYENLGCTGAVYVRPDYLPRQPFQIANDWVWYVRPDWLQPATVSTNSYTWDGGVCDSGWSMAELLPVSSLTGGAAIGINPPFTGWAGPLHREQ